MNERFIPGKIDLTAIPNNSTLNVKGSRQGRGKDIFMPDGPGNLHQEPPIGSDITSPEKPKIITEQGTSSNEGPKRVSPEKARDAWREHYEKQGIDMDKLQDSDENMTVRLAISNGRIPEDTTAGKTSSLSKEEADRIDDLDEEQIRIELKKHGIPSIAGGAPGINLTGITDEEMLAIGVQYNDYLATVGESTDNLKDLWKQLSAMKVEAGQESDKTMLLKRIGETIVNARIKEAEDHKARGDERTGYFYLQPEDIKKLAESPEKWLNEQFDILYRQAKEGQELSSPLVQRIQSAVGDAVHYVNYVNEKELDVFQKRWIKQLALVSMRAQIGRETGIEDIIGGAQNLGLDGLLYAFSLENGTVGAMFNRFNKLLEAERLKSEQHHVTPELVGKLQDQLVKEQLELAKNGGLFADATEKDIERAVAIASDVFIVSERMSLIVARGKHLSGNDAYISDPASGPFNALNLGDLLIHKYNLLNEHEQEYLNQTLIDMAEENLKERHKSIRSMNRKDKIELGTGLFRDLFAVPTFFDSGWRIDGIKSAIEERIGKEKAKDFALFMRAKQLGKPGDHDKKHPKNVPERIRVWGKIVEYRPEEIMRLFKERDSGRLSDLYVQLEAIDHDLSLTPDDLRHNKEIDDKNEEMKREPNDMGKITVYDKFEEKYGAVLSLLREQAFKIDPPKQVDFAHLDGDQRYILNQAMKDVDPQAAHKLTQMGSKMQNYIREKGLVSVLWKDSKFEDIYTRTLVVDDALLERLETVTDEQKKAGIVPLSKKLASDKRGDAFVRSYKDLGHAGKAGQALVGFLKHVTDDKANEEQSRAFGESVSQYNGENARAKCLRFTRGTYLILSLEDGFMDALGISKVGRKPISKIQEIFGGHIEPISRDKARVEADKMKHEMIGHDEELWKRFQQKLQLSWIHTAKRKGVSFLAALLVALGVELYEISGVKQATATGGR